MPKNIKDKNYVRFLLVLLTAVVLSAVYVSFWGTARSAVSKPAPEITLNVIPLKPSDTTIKKKYIGYITPIRSVDLVPNVSGYIDEVWVEGGQEVKAGDNLLLIDQREYKAELDAAKSAVVQAQADYNNAKSYYQRIKRAGIKAVSQSELDSAKAQFLSAQGVLEEARANLDKARVLYDYTILQSPISGQVGNVDLTRGNYVSPASSPLLKIIQYDPIRVVFSISDKEYLDEISRHADGNLFNGESIRLRLADGKTYSRSGVFKFTGNELDKTTNSISIYADFANPGKELVANAYVDVLLERAVKGAFLIRQNYVTLAPEGAYVYTVKNNQLLKTPVNIITTVGSDYLVGNKFADGEYLVVDKVGRISKDAKVKIKVAAGEKD